MHGLSGSLAEARNSPLRVRTQTSGTPQNLHESSAAPDGLSLSSFSSRSSAPTDLRLHPHQRTASDSSSLSIDSHVDSAILPFTFDQDFVTPSPTMPQPTISRYSSHGAWANRLEQRAESYNYQGCHTTPLTPPPPQHIKQSPSNRTSEASHYHHGVSAPSNYALGSSPSSTAQFAPYLPSSPTPVTPTFNDFSMDSVITSPQAQPNHNWHEEPGSPFDLHPDESSYNPNGHSQHQLPSFDEAKVQPWWPPASRGAASHPAAYNSRLHRQTSAPAMNPSQAQYGGYYPATFSGAVIGCQPGANEMGRPSVSYATSAPSGRSYQRHPSMPQLGGSRQPSQLSSSSRFTTTSSGANSRRALKGHARAHGRSKSSASPPRQSMRDAPSSGNLGFVNYGPDDSKRILTGVAPSGSSKTKARREKEARERQRRMNEAAQRAVMEAGGDVSALERSGLFA